MAREYCAYGGNERLRVEVAYRPDLVDSMARKQGIAIIRTVEQREQQYNELHPKGTVAAAEEGA